jgi:hypothetical protein
VVSYRVNCESCELYLCRIDHDTDTTHTVIISYNIAD